MTQANVAAEIDLWGGPFVSHPTDSAPTVLLRQQAEILTTRTGGRIEGVVLTDFDKGTLWASLYAKVPRLQGYMYKLLTVAHPVTDSPDAPARMTAHDTFRDREDWQSLDSMEQFTAWLKEALSSDRAHAVIVNMLNYIPDHATT